MLEKQTREFFTLFPPVESGKSLRDSLSPQTNVEEEGEICSMLDPIAEGGVKIQGAENIYISEIYFYS